MFLRRISDFFHTLAFRLTLWYGAIFTLFSFIAFFLFYLLITSLINERTDEELLNQSKEFSAVYALNGLETLKQAAFLKSQAGGEKVVFFRLLYPSGVVFSSSNMSYWKHVGIDRHVVDELIRGKNHVFMTINGPHAAYPVRIIYSYIDPGIILQFGRSMESYARLIDVFRKIFLSTMSFLILSALAIGWFMARRAIVGVEEVTQTARNISGNDLEKRVPVKSRGFEIDQLAVTFNNMLDRIQQLVTGIREMSDNIAHDLKSPVTRIRGLAEITLTDNTSARDYELMAANTIEECDRLLDMINTMLVISETKAGVEKRPLDLIDPAEIVEHGCELFRPAAEDKHIELTCTIRPVPSFTGNKPLIQRMTANIIDNAVKYTPPKGKIDVGLHQDPNNTDQIMITVEDTGAGISDNDRPLIFRRFFRCDQSRFSPGNGLGLSLADAVARSHGGRIEVDSTLGKGSRFTVILCRSSS